MTYYLTFCILVVILEAIIVYVMAKKGCVVAIAGYNKLQTLPGFIGSFILAPINLTIGLPVYCLIMYYFLVVQKKTTEDTNKLWPQFKEKK